MFGWKALQALLSASHQKTQNVWSTQVRPCQAWGWCLGVPALGGRWHLMTLSAPYNSEVFVTWKFLIVETGALPFWWQLALGEEVWQGPLSHPHRCPLGNLTSLKTSSSKKSCPWIPTLSPLTWGDGGVLPHQTWTSWWSAPHTVVGWGLAGSPSPPRDRFQEGP